MGGGRWRYVMVGMVMVVIMVNTVVTVARGPGGKVARAVVRPHADNDLTLPCVLGEHHVSLVSHPALTRQSHGDSGHLLAVLLGQANKLCSVSGVGLG